MNATVHRYNAYTLKTNCLKIKTNLKCHHQAEKHTCSKIDKTTINKEKKSNSPLNITWSNYINSLIVEKDKNVQ